MVEEALKPIVIPLNGKLITAQDGVTLGEGDFQNLVNMRYGDATPQSILGMTKYNNTLMVDGTASPGTYMKTRSGFHFKKSTPNDLGGG